MPRRLLHKKPLLIFSSGAVVVAAFVSSSWSLHQRTQDVNRLIYEQCVANEVQDSVIVSQLRAAQVRARATLPRDSDLLRTQLQNIQDGIDALEPPDEPNCNPPKGTSP